MPRPLYPRDDPTPGADPGFVRPEAYTIFGGSFTKTNTRNYEFSIRYESEYLFRTPPRILEEARASKGP